MILHINAMHFTKYLSQFPREHPIATTHIQQSPARLEPSQLPQLGDNDFQSPAASRTAWSANEGNLFAGRHGWSAEIDLHTEDIVAAAAIVKKMFLRPPGGQNNSSGPTELAANIL